MALACRPGECEPGQFIRCKDGVSVYECRHCGEEVEQFEDGCPD